MSETRLEARVLLDGLAFVESPRWHEGRLWFAHWGTGEIVAVDLEGRGEVVGEGPHQGLGWAFDWLPDGRMLVTGDELIRREPNGSSVQHADLSDLAPFWNDVVVDGRGNIYLNSINFHYVAGAEVTPGLIALVTPDRTARKVAGDLTFPNGMVITPDNSTLLIGESMAGRVTAFDIAEDGSLSNRRVWAQGLGPDGITMDTDGALWVQTPDHPRGSIVRMREGGETLARIDHDRSILAAMLGGPDGTTLFLLAVEWRGLGKVEETIAARTGQVLVAQAPAPRAGWP